MEFLSANSSITEANQVSRRQEISPWHSQHLPEVADAEYISNPENAEVHLRDYWRMLVKHRRLVVLVFLVVVGFGTYLTFSATPLYTASATLEIGSQDPAVIQLKALLTTIEQGSPADTYYETQCALLKSRPLAARVITDLGLESDTAFTRDDPSLLDRMLSWFFDLIDSVLTHASSLMRSPPTETQKPSPLEELAVGVHPGLIGRYLHFLSVSPVKGTQLVQVVFTTPDPHLSQKLADAHAAAFIRTALETRFELTAEAREFLQQKRVELQAKVQKAEETLQRFRREHDVVSPEGSENIVVERMIDLNRRLTEARARRIELESLHRTVENQNSRYLSEIIDNNVIQQLKTSLLALEAEQARLSATFTPAHPRLIELSEQISEARRRMDREIANVVRKIESDYGAACAKEEALQAEAERQQQAALNLKEIGVEYAVLKAEVDSSRAVHESVLKRLNETNISNDVPVSNIQIRERAEKPRLPSFPQTQRSLVLAASCGLLLGSGLALFLEYMDSSISTPEDAWRAMAVPTLGVVPHVRFLRRRIYGYSHLPKRSPANGLAHPWTAQGHSFSQHLTIAHHPLSLFSESYRTIHTVLQLTYPEQSPRVILLTSAHPGEGKTMTTVNLAITLAQSDHTVVVIDADLRKGSCHTLLGQHNHRGLSQIITGSVTLEESLQVTPVAGLSFLSRGAIVPNPIGLLRSHRMREVVETLREHFEFVLMDSAPATAVSDAAVLSQLSDGVLLVIRGQRTTSDTARRAVEHLEAVHAQILGVVLNGVDIRNPAYADYCHYYTSYYAAAQKTTEE